MGRCGQGWYPEWVGVVRGGTQNGWVWSRVGPRMSGCGQGWDPEWVGVVRGGTLNPFNHKLE